MDSLSDEKGYYRLSTLQTYAYHMANNLDEHAIALKEGGENLVSEDLIRKAQNSKVSPFSFFLRKLVFRILKRFFKL